MVAKKPKGQKMDLSSFLQDNTMGTSWADEVTDLPTAPAAALASTSSYSATTSFQGQSYACDDEIEIPVPDEPPFTAFIGNLSFNVTENDISLFFGERTVKTVRIIIDMQTQRPKGYGYVEFEDRQGLVNALKMNGESLQNRNVRVNVAEGSKKNSKFDDGKFGNNWRLKPAAGVERGFRDQFSRNKSPERVSGFSGSKFGGADGGFRRREGSGSGAFGGGFRRREGSEGGFGSRPQTANFDRRPSDTVTPAPAIAKSKSNPFGNAVPRDEYAIQQAIEERRQAREAAKESQRLIESKARADIESKSKSNREERPKKEETVPQAAGSWRRSASAKPAFTPKTKDDSKSELFGKGKKQSAFTSRKEEFERRTTEVKPKIKADSSTGNIFDSLPTE